MIRKVIPLSEKDIVGVLLSEEFLNYSYDSNDYFDDKGDRIPGIWDNFKIIKSTIEYTDLYETFVDYKVVVQHLPSGEYYSGKLREFVDEKYESLCEELTQVFPTPVTEIKYT